MGSMRGYLTLRDTSADNTNQVVKASPGHVVYFQISNGGTVDAYLHFYDALTANVTVGTTTPKATFLVPAGVGTTQVGAYEFTGGAALDFQTGIIYACSTTVTGGTDCTVKPVLGILQYK